MTADAVVEGHRERRLNQAIPGGRNSSNLMHNIKYDTYRVYIYNCITVASPIRNSFWLGWSLINHKHINSGNARNQPKSTEIMEFEAFSSWAAWLSWSSNAPSCAERWRTADFSVPPGPMISGPRWDRLEAVQVGQLCHVSSYRVYQMRRKHLGNFTKLGILKFSKPKMNFDLAGRKPKTHKDTSSYIMIHCYTFSCINTFLQHGPLKFLMFNHVQSVVFPRLEEVPSLRCSADLFSMLRDVCQSSDVR